ncbi:MAG: hypothetical protein ACRDHI_03580 [Actinomycetota bacterium]
MKGKTIVWIVSAAMTVVAAGSLGLGIAGAADSNTSGRGAAPAPRGTAVPAIVMGAVVKSGGQLARSTTSGITSDGLGSGSYEVLFPINVRQCTYVATIGKTTHSGQAKPGFITTVGRVSSTRGVFVSTYDKRGQGAKRPFHLEVSCAELPV